MPSSITSDRDYLELFDSNTITLSASSTQADTDGRFPQTVMSDYPFDVGNSTTVTHSLGSVPIVRLFYDPDKNGTLYSTPRYTTGDYLAEVSGARPFYVNTTTTTKILLNAPSSVTNIPIHYRIYRFGDKGVTSDEAIDKIFAKGTSSKSVGAASDSFSPQLGTDTIPHGKGAQILWKLQFAENVNGPWYDEGNILFGSPDTSTGPPGGPYTNYYYKTAYGYANSTNFFVNYVHNHSSSQTIYVRYVLEEKEGNRMLSTDFDAYRSDGVVHTKSLVFSGSVGAGAEKTVTTTFDLTDQDFHQLLFDNSVYSSGKFRDTILEWGTVVHESTRDSVLAVTFETFLSGNTLTLKGKLFNPYDGSVTLDSTTIGFRLVAYDSVLL